MKFAYAMAVAAVFVTGPAVAEVTATVDLSKLTCAQLTAYKDEDKATIMMWLEGYYTGDDDDPIVDFQKMAGDLAQLLIYCGNNPTTDIITASDGIMGEDVDGSEK
jgi:acid stress chaperone HdeB